MAPTIERGKTSRKASKPRRTHFKKNLVKPTKVLLEDLPSNCSTKTTSDHNFSKINGCDIEGVDDDVSTTSPCSTPKAQRFRIPEMDTCPPAPKKQRVVSNCTLQRSTPIAFFAPPDIELFFLFALTDISV